MGSPLKPTFEEREQERRRVLAEIRDGRLARSEALEARARRLLAWCEVEFDCPEGALQRDALEVTGLDPSLAGPAHAMTGGTMAKPAVPGLLEGGKLTPDMAQTFVSEGGDPRVLASLIPEPISPYQQAQLDISRAGQDIQREGMTQEREQFAQTMGLRREQFASDQEYNRAKLALDAAELAQTGGAKLSDVAGIRKEFTDRSQDFISPRDAFGRISAAATDPNPAGDQG
jgi:hypothetical protein